MPTISAVGGETTVVTTPSQRGEWLRVADAARLLGVSANTLRRASSFKGVRCYRSPGGHRRYRLDDVNAFLAARHGAAEAGLGARPPGPSERGAPRAGGARRGGRRHPRAQRHGARRGPAFARAHRGLRCAASTVSTGDIVQGLALSDEDGCWEPGDSWHEPLSELPAVLRVLESREVLVLQGPADPRLGEAERVPFLRNGFSSEMLLPLIVEGRTVGLHRPVLAPRAQTGPTTCTSCAAWRSSWRGRSRRRCSSTRWSATTQRCESWSRSASCRAAHSMSTTWRGRWHAGWCTRSTSSACDLHAIDGDTARVVAGYGSRGFADEADGQSNSLERSAHRRGGGGRPRGERRRRPQRPAARRRRAPALARARAAQRRLRAAGGRRSCGGRASTFSTRGRATTPSAWCCCAPWRRSSPGRSRTGSWSSGCARPPATCANWSTRGSSSAPASIWTTCSCRSRAACATSPGPTRCDLYSVADGQARALISVDDGVVDESYRGTTYRCSDFDSGAKRSRSVARCT